MWHKKYVVELTEEGRRAAERWQKTDERPEGFYPPNPSPPNATVYQIAVAVRKFEAVTGISLGRSEAHRVVEFIYHWKPLPDARFF